MSDALLANYHVVQMAFGLLFGAFGKFRLPVTMEFWKLGLAYYSRFWDFVPPILIVFGFVPADYEWSLEFVSR